MVYDIYVTVPEKCDSLQQWQAKVASNVFLTSLKKEVQCYNP